MTAGFIVFAITLPKFLRPQFGQATCSGLGLAAASSYFFFVSGMGGRSMWNWIFNFRGN